MHLHQVLVFIEDSNTIIFQKTIISPCTALKKAYELLAYAFNHLHRLNVTGFYFFIIYRLRGRLDVVLYEFIDRISHGIEMQWFRDGSSSKGHMRITSAVDWFARSFHQTNGCETCNLGKCGET